MMLLASEISDDKGLSYVMLKHLHLVLNILGQNY